MNDGGGCVDKCSHIWHVVVELTNRRENSGNIFNLNRIHVFVVCV